ncbi:hypothetical protein Bca52824_017803 [Brassica carinata]|uniref:Uncharacterized protein n=1 Tax=Brassica carinata TaxID=52824 RepID=A0A8X7VNR2_BRACI|nr:hypothetical protein Bca52824_017803 [Brassica carinata]
MATNRNCSKFELLPTDLQTEIIWRLAKMSRPAVRSYQKAVYLYGIIKLCSGEPAIGRAMIDSLGWMENKARVDNCWRRIKQSLHGVRVLQLQSYTATYWNTKATITCHPDNVEERCDNCFYYKQITKFVFII